MVASFGYLLLNSAKRASSSSLLFSSNASSFFLLISAKSFNISFVSSGYAIRNISDLSMDETSFPFFLEGVKRTWSVPISTLYPMISFPFSR